MKPLPPKYALHPGPVYSLDGDCHWIGYWQLIRLYKLHPRDCIEWNSEAPETFIGRREKDYIHLYALSSGRYLEIRLAMDAQMRKSTILDLLKEAEKKARKKGITNRYAEEHKIARSNLNKPPEEFSLTDG